MVRSQFPLLLCQAQSSSRRQRVPLPHPQDGDWWLVNGDLGTSLILLAFPQGINSHNTIPILLRGDGKGYGL